MKQVFVFTAMSVLIAAGAQAVEFNKDAPTSPPAVPLASRQCSPAST